MRACRSCLSRICTPMIGLCVRRSTAARSMLADMAAKWLAEIPCSFGTGEASERIAELLRGFLRSGAG